MIQMSPQLNANYIMQKLYLCHFSCLVYPLIDLLTFFFNLGISQYCFGVKKKTIYTQRDFSHLASASVALTIAHTATKTAGTPEITHSKQ